MPIILSGLQPTGAPHLGNYFGAIKQHIELQQEPGEHYYFIADYHALTSHTDSQGKRRDPAHLRECVIEVAATYLALGLDPERTVFFRQSDVPEVTELAWLLSTVTGMGLLERAHSYKDKVARGLPATAGLFFYPVLMAADILAYDSDLVPVGKDQVQHVEMTQDMAGYFNERYGPVFKRPEARLPASDLAAKVPGLDGEKMSKSYSNTIWVFESGKPLKKTLGRIVTDSRASEDPKDPEALVVCQLLKLFLPAGEYAELAESVRRGGTGAPGYGHMKQQLAEAMERHFATARARREELLAEPGRIEGVLRRGAERARERARATRDRALLACGLR